MWRTSPSPQNCEDVTNVSTCSQRSPEKATGATCPSDTPSPKGIAKNAIFWRSTLRVRSPTVCFCALSLTFTHTHQPHLQPFLVTHSHITSACSASVAVGFEAFHEYLLCTQRLLFPS